MILVIGGFASGKREYVKEAFGYTDDDMADAVIDNRPVIYNLQDLVAKKPESSLSLLPALLDKKVVICNEVGSGVIPVSRHEREAREATGRLCIAIAKHAERVIRLQCGIPIVIKG